MQKTQRNIVDLFLADILCVRKKVLNFDIFICFKYSFDQGNMLTFSSIKVDMDLITNHVARNFWEK